MRDLSLPISATFVLLWLYLIAPMGLRLFGLRVPLKINKRVEFLQRLDFPRFLLLYGVVTWGIAGFTYSVLYPLCEWRFSAAWEKHDFVPAPFNSPWRMLLVLVIWTSFGSFLACLAWKRLTLGGTRPSSV
jgi:hypothetical protein